MKGVFMRCFLALLIVSLLPSLAIPQEWTEHNIITNSSWVTSVRAADIDSDGDIDVLSAYEYGLLRWWENLDGTGIVWSAHTVDSFNWIHSVHAADLDGDGDMDVLATVGHSDDADELLLLINENGQGTDWSIQHLGYWGMAHTLQATDMDGDGDLDVLSSWELDVWDGVGEVYWWENVDGTGTLWDTHDVDVELFGAEDVYAADVDGDGDLDVLGVTMYANTISWWENIDGSATSWIRHTVNDDFPGAISIHAADIDGDGDADFVAAAYDGDEIAWGENVNGTGMVWSEHVVDGEFDGAISVLAADIDGDGDIDLAGAAYDVDEVTWWENNGGPGTVWIEHILSTEFDSPYEVHIADIEGDGDMDVLSAAGYEDSEVVWWEQPGGQDPPLIEVSLFAGQPLQIPRGGSFEYGIFLSNNLPSLFYVDFWTYVNLPDGTPFGPIWRINNVPMAPNTTIRVNAVGQSIPNEAPLGEYTFHMQAGAFPNVVAGEDEFPFEVVAATGTNGSPSTDWSAWGLDQLQSQSIAQNSYVEAWPNTFSLSESYPNPFNAATTLTVNLPENAELSVTVYNISGQQVAELANGSYTAGTHRFTFDASGLASGLYFVKATVPGQMDQVQKVMLVR